MFDQRLLRLAVRGIVYNSTVFMCSIQESMSGLVCIIHYSKSLFCLYLLYYGMYLCGSTITTMY